MNITERLFYIIEKKQMKLSDFAKAINTTSQALNNWKNRGTTPPMEYLPLICDTLDISWEWLVTGENSEETYTREEKYLISKYRDANKSGKTKILEYAQDIARIHPAQDEKETTLETKIG